MYIQKVSLTGYRNLKDITLFLKNGVNIFYGENAQGKTNFLDYIYVLLVVLYVQKTIANL